jgi:hypothetical protein
MGYLDAVRADRPALLWPLWEGGGTVARDYSGNGRNGTYNDTSVLRAGPVGPGTGVLLGTSKYVESAASLTLGSSFALEVWFNKHSHLAGQPGDINSVIGDLFSTSNGVLVRYDGTSTLRLYYANGSGFQTITAPAAPAHRTAVHLVASVKSGGRARLILNGTVVVDAATSGTPSGFSGNFRVGRSEDGRYLDGDFAWAAAYNAELTLDSARRHYDAALRARPRGRSL